MNRWVKFFVCAFRGHHYHTTEEQEEYLRANPDKDLPIGCDFCGLACGKLYYSKKRGRLRAYEDDSPAIFGDVYRD